MNKSRLPALFIVLSILCVFSLALRVVSADEQVLGQVEKFWTHIPADTPETWEISNDVIGFTAIDFTLSMGTPSVRISVDALSEVPSHLAPSDSEVYKVLKVLSLEVDPDNLEGLATIKFKVSKDWIKSNGIDKNTVHLKRYKSGSWAILDTKLVSEGLSSVFYEAKTPGFSYFVIAGLKEVDSSPVVAAADEFAWQDAVASEPAPVVETRGEVEKQPRLSPPAQAGAPAVEPESKPLLQLPFQVKFDWLIDYTKGYTKDYPPAVPYVAVGVVLGILLILILVHVFHHHSVPVPPMPSASIMDEPPAPSREMMSSPVVDDQGSITFVGGAPDPSLMPSKEELEEVLGQPAAVAPAGSEAVVKEELPAGPGEGMESEQEVVEEEQEPAVLEAEEAQTVDLVSEKRYNINNPVLADIAKSVRRMLAQGRVSEAKSKFLEGKNVYQGLKARGEATMDLYNALKKLHDDIQRKLNEAS
ncbi:PGF-pre-PGF domain-containing protein [Candidatus Woesearchaeota archaeon]|nr:PGF-pre-PGF domain-containing protein [Candidatus Woesearchaeota archaeon]